MPTRTAKPAGDAELLEELRRRKARVDNVEPAELTAEERHIAGLMRERDHREGCPAIADPGHAGHARVEAFVQPVVSPAPELKAQGVAKGDRIVVAHCMTCGTLRYFPGYGTIEDLLIAVLEGKVSADRPTESTDDETL